MRIRLTCVAGLSLCVLLGGCAAGAGKKTAEQKAEDAYDFASYYNTGLAAAQEGRHEAALVEYVKALNLQPRNADVQYLAAESQKALGRTDGAIDAYRRALAAKPDHVAALEGLGLLLLHKGKRDAARPHLEKVVALRPQAWASLDGLGVIEDLRKNYAVAQDYYRRALAVNPNSATVLNNLGYSLYLEGRYEQALTQLHQALAVDPRHERAWRNIGLILARTGRYEESQQAFAKVMPETEAAYSTAYVCLLDHRLDEAERYFRRAIALSPSYYREAQEGLAQVFAARSQPPPASKPEANAAAGAMNPQLPSVPTPGPIPTDPRR